MEDEIKRLNPTLHKCLFTITTFSKILAIILFIVLPFVGFYLGMKYQQKITVVAPSVQGFKNIPTPTLTTLVLRDEKAGFEFKYPSSMKYTKVAGAYNFYDLYASNYLEFRLLVDKHTDFSLYKECLRNQTYPCINRITYGAGLIGRYKVGELNMEGAWIADGKTVVYTTQTQNPPYFQFQFINRLSQNDQNDYDIVSNFKLIK